MRKYPRIEIDQLAYDGLQIEAVLQHKTPREIATKAILGYISEKALSAIDHTTDRPQDHKTTEDRPVTITDKSQKRKRLSENPEAIAKLKELWYSTPRPSIMEIARQIAYPKATVAENIKRLKDKGELD